MPAQIGTRRTCASPSPRGLRNNAGYDDLLAPLLDYLAAQDHEGPTKIVFTGMLGALEIKGWHDTMHVARRA